MSGSVASLLPLKTELLQEPCPPHASTVDWSQCEPFPAQRCFSQVFGHFFKSDNWITE